MLGREGCPGQRIVVQGRDRGAQDQGEKVGAYLHMLKGSRSEQAHEIRPNCIYYDYGYNKNQTHLSDSQGNEWTAGEADKIDQIQENVLTNATTHKETIVQKHFWQKLSSLGSRR